MPDRVNGPLIHPIGQHITLPTLSSYQLDNKLQVHSYQNNSAEVVQINVVFNAGLWHHPTKLVSFLTNRLMKEGTVNHTSKAIAEKMDFYGASLYNQHDSDMASYGITCLKKHLPSVLPLLAEILQQPSYSEAELSLQCKLGKEGLKQEKEKTETIANDNFYRALYGENHPYGRVNEVSDYDKVNTAVIKAYHQSHYHPGNAYIFVAGAVDDQTAALLNTYLGTNAWAPKVNAEIPQYSIEAATTHQLYQEKKDAVQSSLRIGNRTIGLRHPDYNGLKIATVLLGGYFGSRLMSNIREEKGYTYGIYATISNRLQDNHFRIGTEVGKEVAKAALKEIYYEMEEMKQAAVDMEELVQVRNYLLGNYMDSLSNVFNTAQLLNNMITYKRTPEDFYETINVLKNITPDEIQQLAQRYFNTAELYEVVAG